MSAVPGSRERRCYLRGRTASFNCLAMRALTTVLAGILMASPVAGFRPIRALRFWTTSFTIPGSTNSPERLSSFSARTFSSSKNSRACVRFTSKRSAKCEKSSDLPILRASAIGYSPCLGAHLRVPHEPRARAEAAEELQRKQVVSYRLRFCGVKPRDVKNPHECYTFLHVAGDVPQPAARS